MKIAVVSPWYPSDGRPIQGIFVEQEVGALLDQGHDVRVVHLDRDLGSGETSLETRKGAPVLRIGMNPAKPISVAKAISPLRGAVDFADVVNTHAISALPAAIAARFTVPWVHTEHWSALSTPESASPLLRAVRPAFATMLKAPDTVVTVDERLAVPIRKFRGDRPVELVPCVVLTPNPLVPLRDRSEGDEGEIRLVSTGAVVDRKNPLLAVETLRELKDRGYHPKLRWFGEGDLRSQAIDLAEELGVDAEFAGAVSPDRVQDLIAWGDMFIGPTKGDNFFTAVAESLASGRPIVASDRGGHVSYVDPRYSEIVTEQTPEAYADAVIRLFAKTEGTTAEDVSGTIADRFAPQVVADSYIDIFSSLLGRP